jgi:hypothetical protein
VPTTKKLKLLKNHVFEVFLVLRPGPMVRKLIFTFGTVLLTSKICFCSSKHDIPKPLKMVIYSCFLDDLHTILDNSCMCLNELILILNGTFFDQKHDFLINRHVLIVIECWKQDLNQ